MIVLGRIFLHTPFSTAKLIAVAVCLGGISCLIAADVTTDRGAQGGMSNSHHFNINRINIYNQIHFHYVALSIAHDSNDKVSFHSFHQ